MVFFAKPLVLCSPCESSSLQDNSPSNNSHSAETSSPELRPSSPSSEASVSTSLGASTSIDIAELHSTSHGHTSISVFYQGSRTSARQHVSGNKPALEPPKLNATGVETVHNKELLDLNATRVEIDRDEDYEDVPHEHEAGRCASNPEMPPTKRSRTAFKYKANTMSPYFELSHLFTECILKEKRLTRRLGSHSRYSAVRALPS